MWPLCVDPPRCDPIIGPVMPMVANITGLTGEYTDIFEGNDILFQCNDSIRALTGGKEESIGNITTTDSTTNETETTIVFKVRCGDKGIWEAPYDEDWPTCELLPSKHCSVEQDIVNATIPDGFALADASVTKVLNNETMSFKCSETGQAAVMADGSRVTQFSFTCNVNGEFESVTWPDSCQVYEGCVTASFPATLNGFSVVSGQTVVAQDSALMLECPDGKVLDTGATVSGPVCSAPDTFGAMPEINATDCRDPVPCPAGTGPAPPNGTDLVCNYNTETQVNRIRIFKETLLSHFLSGIC